MNISFLMVTTVVLAALAGCASIVNGQNQSLSVEARSDSGPVSGTNCKLSNNKGTWFVTTPGSTLVQRSFEDLAVRCERDDYEPGLISVKSNTKGMAFGNILFGGIIGAGVDMSTGAAYDYPTLITVSMGSKKSTSGVAGEVVVSKTPLPSTVAEPASAGAAVAAPAASAALAAPAASEPVRR